MNDEFDFTRAKHSRVAFVDPGRADRPVGPDLREPDRHAFGPSLPRPNEIVIDATPVGASLGWPRIAGPTPSVGPGQLDDAKSSKTVGPTRTEARAGSLSLTREHLETWIEQLRASHPDAETHHNRNDDPTVSRQGPPRRIPDRDIVVVGRRPMSEARLLDERDGGAKSRLAFGATSRSRTPPIEGAWTPGSLARTVLLAIVLAFSLIWAAYSFGLFSPAPIEIPTTLNDRSAIVWRAQDGSNSQG